MALHSFIEIDRLTAYCAVGIFGFKHIRPKFSSMTPFKRLAATNRPAISLTFNGHPVAALEGDTVLTALLVSDQMVGISEFDGTPRAGFCLMGACQDCWVRDHFGKRIRACTETALDGMILSSMDGTP